MKMLRAIAALLKEGCLLLLDAFTKGRDMYWH